MLVACFVASPAFQSSAPVLAPASRRPAAALARLSLEPAPWPERVQSAKAAGIAAVSGSVASAPVKASALLASNALSKGKESVSLMNEWVFCTVELGVELALFGAVYRCIVRSDDNDMLKQGAIGAFALCRALASTQILKDTNTWMQIGTYFGESALAFSAAAAALEFAWDRGWCRRLPGIGLPPYYYDDYDDPRSYFRDNMPYYRDGPGLPLQSSSYRGDMVSRLGLNRRDDYNSR